jgi:hypothetical protein
MRDLLFSLVLTSPRLTATSIQGDASLTNVLTTILATLMYDCGRGLTMRIIVSLVSFLFLTNIFSTTPQQNDQSCGFTVQGEPAHGVVTGPDDIVPLVYLVEQPDSPIEILSVDLQGMWLSVSGEQHTEHFCNKFKVRNRSDRVVQKFSIELLVSAVSSGGGSGASSTSPIAPGESVEISSCNGGGNGGAPGNHVRILVSVRSVDLGGCLFRPSQRIPRTLGVKPVWS